MTTDDPRPAGWYDDPTAPDRWRWWDGRQWTDHTRTPAGPSQADLRAAPPPTIPQQPSPPVSTPPPPASDDSPRRAWWPVVGSVALLAGLAAGAYALGWIGPSDTDPVAAPPSPTTTATPSPSLTPTPTPPSPSPSPPDAVTPTVVVPESSPTIQPSEAGTIAVRPSDAPTSRGAPVAAGGVLRRNDQDWVVEDTSLWDPQATLNVLIGTNAAGEQFAFFYADGELLGTDTFEPSRDISIAWTDDDAAGLTYGLWQPGESRDGPPSEHATVAYQWDGERLQPLDPIPPADPAEPGARR